MWRQKIVSPFLARLFHVYRNTFDTGGSTERISAYFYVMCKNTTTLTERIRAYFFVLPQITVRSDNAPCRESESCQPRWASSSRLARTRVGAMNDTFRKLSRMVTLKPPNSIYCAVHRKTLLRTGGKHGQTWVACRCHADFADNGGQRLLSAAHFAKTSVYFVGGRCFIDRFWKAMAIHTPKATISGRNRRSASRPLRNALGKE